ncbi:MAG: hypothetical protein K2I00_10585, partial [Ruminococcus sp.]|nr:hypothetical protein [Ruminococcus sp.]
MQYDLDYEIYKYIDEQADSYVPFKDFLKNHDITFDEAWRCVQQFKDNFNNLLSKYSIGSQNLSSICNDLMERIVQQSDNPDLHYLYFCIITDFGLLNDVDFSDHTKEQDIRNYFRQKELIQELSDFLKCQTENNRKLDEIREHLKKPICLKNFEYTDETDFLYHQTIQHTFLHDSIKNEVYKDNIKSLIIHINSDEKLTSVKPYIIFSVLARKTGMMQKRENYLPNLKSLFQYQEYNIHRDNGKNFNMYQSEIELYYHLKSIYSNEIDIDMELSDFCFANLSPLSEWYYINCEPNEDIP